MTTDAETTAKQTHPTGVTDPLPTIDPMVEPEIVRQLRHLHAQGWGIRALARELGIGRNAVRRYLRGGTAADVQTRPRARRLDAAAVAEALELFDGAAEGNAVVVTQMLAERGRTVGLRTVQRAVADRRRDQRVAELATVRYETAPGQQMQIDFGQKRVQIGAAQVVVHFLVAVLCFSRRVFVKAFLAERQDDWREGIAEAFRHFGGVTHIVLGDNARSLVVEHDRLTGAVTWHPGYLSFCRDWDVEPRACAPYRARTKGKTESGVKYVKRNALAGREFESFAALEAHLAAWTSAAVQRVHGTTHERPIDRFERAERVALRALPSRAIPARERRVERRVAHDAMVDVDTVRYSVPYRLIRDHVEVAVGDTDVCIFHRGELVATHRRSSEPHACVVDHAHYAGLLRRPATDAEPTVVADPQSPLEAMGRSLADYAAALSRGGDA